MWNRKVPPPGSVDSREETGNGWESQDSAMVRRIENSRKTGGEEAYVGALPGKA